MGTSHNSNFRSGMVRQSGVRPMLSSCGGFFSPLFFLFCNTEDKTNKPILTVTETKFPSEQQLAVSLSAKPCQCSPVVLQRSAAAASSVGSLPAASAADTAQGFAFCMSCLSALEWQPPIHLHHYSFFFFANGVINN